MAVELEVRAWQVADEQGCCLIYARTRSAAKWAGAQKLGRDFKGLSAKRWAAWDWARDEPGMVGGMFVYGDMRIIFPPKRHVEPVFEVPVEAPRLPWWRRLLGGVARLGSSGRKTPERAG